MKPITEEEAPNITRSFHLMGPTGVKLIYFTFINPDTDIPSLKQCQVVEIEGKAVYL